MNEQIDPKPKKSISKRWWFWVLFIIVLIVVIAASSGSQTTDTNEVVRKSEELSVKEDVNKCTPIDDLTTFTCRYGTPDEDYNSANEKSKPLVITRMLTYKKEGVRAVYVPQTKQPPFEKWTLVAFQDPMTKERISLEEVIKRMEARDKNTQ